MNCFERRELRKEMRVFLKKKIEKMKKPFWISILDKEICKMLMLMRLKTDFPLLLFFHFDQRFPFFDFVSKLQDRKWNQKSIHKEVSKIRDEIR